MTSQMPLQHDLLAEPTASEAIDADMERLLEQYAAELRKDGLTDTSIALACRVAQRAYMAGWYRGHDCAGKLHMRIDREIREAREGR